MGCCFIFFYSLDKGGGGLWLIHCFEHEKLVVGKFVGDLYKVSLLLQFSCLSF